MNNVFENSQYGLYVTRNAFNKAKGCPIVSRNTFTGCETAIYIDVSKNPGKLLSFNQNKFKNCGVNIAGTGFQLFWNNANRLLLDYHLLSKVK